MDFETFLKDYIWVPIVVGILLVIIIIIVLCYCYRCCRNSSRGEYMPLREEDVRLYGNQEIGINQRLDNERNQKQRALESAAWLNAQYYLRANPEYNDIKQLEILGSRSHKTWFLVPKKQLLLTMTDKPEKMIPTFTKQTCRAIKDMLNLLQHPFIYPIHNIDFMVDQNIVVVMYQICKRGSLKDFIYQNSYTEPWRSKYRTKKRGLSVTQIRCFGKQILMALIFIEEKGLPPHGHVHSGNILLDNNCCRLMACENAFIGEEPKIYPLIRKKLKQNKDAIDVISFGHLLYEMCVGAELDSAHPQPAHLSLCKNPDIISILNFIFPETGSSYPSLKDIASQDFFSQVPLPVLENYRFPPISLNKEMKNIVKAIKQGIRMANRRKTKLKRAESTAGMQGSQADIHHVDESRIPATPNTSAPAPPPPAPPAMGSVPPPPPGPPPVGAPPPPPPPGPAPGAPPAPPPSSSGRSALLGDIRKGMSLKKTKTNDKSAPKL